MGGPICASCRSYDRLAVKRDITIIICDHDQTMLAILKPVSQFFTVALVIRVRVVRVEKDDAIDKFRKGIESFNESLNETEYETATPAMCHECNASCAYPSVRREN